MTQNDIKLAVIAVNNTLSTNNPKGLTEALKRIGYPVDSRFDIMSYDALNKALLELYLADPVKWGQVMQSVPFNYQKTDSSTSQNTKTLFENIIRSYDPTYMSATSTAKEKTPAWLQTALGWIVGNTTTTSTGYAPQQIKSTLSTWVYVTYAVLGLAILGIVYITFKQKNI